MDAFVSPTLQAHFAKLSGGLSSSPATNSSYDAAFAYPHAHLGLTHAPGVALPNASGRLAPTPVLDLQRLATPFAEDPLLMDRNLVAAYAVQVRDQSSETAVFSVQPFFWLSFFFFPFLVRVLRPPVSRTKAVASGRGPRLSWLTCAPQQPPKGQGICARLCFPSSPASPTSCNLPLSAPMQLFPSIPTRYASMVQQLARWGGNKGFSVHSSLLSLFRSSRSPRRATLQPARYTAFYRASSHSSSHITTRDALWRSPRASRRLATEAERQNRRADLFLPLPHHVTTKKTERREAKRDWKMRGKKNGAPRTIEKFWHGRNMAKQKPPLLKMPPAHLGSNERSRLRTAALPECLESRKKNARDRSNEERDRERRLEGTPSTMTTS